MTTEQPVWTAELQCRYCATQFTVDATTVIYGDLRQPNFFTPDMQYYAVCPTCEKNYILTEELPSHVAVWIQTKIYTPK